MTTNSLNEQTLVPDLHLVTKKVTLHVYSSMLLIINVALIILLPTFFSKYPTSTLFYFTYNFFANIFNGIMQVTSVFAYFYPLIFIFLLVYLVIISKNLISQLKILGGIKRNDLTPYYDKLDKSVNNYGLIIIIATFIISYAITQLAVPVTIISYHNGLLIITISIFEYILRNKANKLNVLVKAKYK